MRICGIVAEYNPFHNGHLHHIRQTRQLLGDDCAIVCCMSGNFVQRGEAALLPKHIRARMALACGADLVLELPSAYALQSAEGFGSAAVYLLNALGVVTDLSFGSECGDIELLQQIAAVLLEHRTIQDTLHLLQTGISYAAARERALYQQIREKSAVIAHPNNILGIEYLKALQTLNSTMVPHTVSRAGAGHDAEAPAESMASASHLRSLLRDPQPGDPSPYMPAEAHRLLQKAAADGMALTDFSRWDAAASTYFLRLTPEQLAQLPDAAEGLEHRLHGAIHSCRTFDAICTAAKTKRYTLSRIRRMLLCAYLGITREDTLSPPPYARVLAFNDTGRSVLRQATEATAVPLITKPAHIRQLSPRAVSLFEKEVLATDLYNAALPAYHQLPIGAEWQQGAHYSK